MINTIHKCKKEGFKATILAGSITAEEDKRFLAGITFEGDSYGHGYYTSEGVCTKFVCAGTNIPVKKEDLNIRLISFERAAEIMEQP